MQDHTEAVIAKMRAGDVSQAAIDAFTRSYSSLVRGETGLLPEASILPAERLARLNSDGVITSDTGDLFKPAGASRETLLSQTAVLKLNGGLGTGMGLERAKSLLVVKDGLTFLDFIAKQYLLLRSSNAAASGLRLFFMNSFSTSEDTLFALKKHRDLGDTAALELMQNRVPKIDAATYAPVSWPENPKLEWCPPGHGDLYPALLGSGLLDRLLADGIQYLFVSNSDNLGASLDEALLAYFAQSGAAFLMEVCDRTGADRKGGHLCRDLATGRLRLRESAQCPEADAEAFQDITKHRYFNTNNLWLNLPALREALHSNGGALTLPTIRNSKTVDPRDKKSTPVFQLETAMGAAIECFPNASAIVVPRERFAPVKSCSDLLALRSDAYEIAPDLRPVLHPARENQPPLVALDTDHYKTVDQLDEAFPGGAPSLRHCKSLKVKGRVIIPASAVFHGDCFVENTSAEVHTLTSGTYSGHHILKTQ